LNISRALTIRGGAQHDITVDWPGLVNGRYVRLETTAPQYLSFAEVEVFGPPPASPPTVAALLPLAGEVLAELSHVESSSDTVSLSLSHSSHRCRLAELVGCSWYHRRRQHTVRRCCLFEWCRGRTAQRSERTSV